MTDQTTSQESALNPQPKTHKKLTVVISIAAALCIAISGYAMTVDKFTDYNPPNSLSIVWGDYFKDSLQDTYKQDNAVTSWPTWSAAYPHRAIFYGARPVSGSLQGHNTNVFVVYSKKPISDIFTFEYHEGAKSTYQTGRIRALYDKIKVGLDQDVRIVTHSWVGVSSGAIDFGFPSSWGTYVYGSNVVGTKAYFEFDFYYKCSNLHQQNAYNVDIQGLRSISSVPYAYILECDQHGTSGGSESGSSSSGGGSSSGGNGSTSFPNKNTSGNGGRHGWGNGEYGGGLDPSGLISRGGDGGDYSSRDDLELSVPDYWQNSHVSTSNPNKYPWEIPENIPKDSFTLEVPEFTDFGEGDTGANGSSIALPTQFPSGVSGYNFTIPPFPAAGKIEHITFPNDLRFTSDFPPKLHY